MPVSFALSPDSCMGNTWSLSQSTQAGPQCRVLINSLQYFFGELDSDIYLFLARFGVRLRLDMRRVVSQKPDIINPTEKVGGKTTRDPSALIRSFRFPSAAP
jgi:hypothetical protein